MIKIQKALNSAIQFDYSIIDYLNFNSDCIHYFIFRTKAGNGNREPVNVTSYRYTSHIYKYDDHVPDSNIIEQREVTEMYRSGIYRSDNSVHYLKLIHYKLLVGIESFSINFIP